MHTTKMDTFSVTCLFLLTSISMLHHVTNATLTETGPTEDESKCKLYMAPTSTILISEDDDEVSPIKLSMYAGTNIPQGTIIGRPEIGIPLTDINTHMKQTVYQSQQQKQKIIKNKQEFLAAQSSFMWNAQPVSAQYETFINHDNLNVCIPGVGGLGNQHPTLVSYAGWNYDAVVERTIDTKSTNVAYPNRGAISHYFNVSLQALQDIPAGMEILVDDLGLEEDEDLYTLKDFHHADRNLKRIHAFFEKYESDLLPVKKKEMYNFLLKDVISASHSNDDDGKDTLPLYPKEPSEIASTIQTGTFQYSYPELTKSTEWLEQNGQCLDGLYPGISTIPDIGRGAFASKNFKKGQMIAPAPLMLIPDKSYLDMYKIKKNGDRLVKGEDVVSKQLLENYSFGHQQSKLRFYPYGINVNFINHKKTDPSGTVTGSDGANAKLSWTKQSYHQSDLLNKNTNELLESGIKDVFTSLGMDIIATRDIAANEEVFIDYGDDWAKAWEDHVSKWDKDQKWPTKALDLNSEMKFDQNLFFDTESEKNKIIQASLQTGGDGTEYKVPPSVITVCYATWNDLDANDGDFGKDSWFKFDDRTEKNGHDMQPCSIIDRYNFQRSSSEGDKEGDNVNDNGTYYYTVELSNGVTTVKNVPQSFIKYGDRPYSSDMMSNSSIGVFRHYIAIPDEMFPQSWRDLNDDTVEVE
mmetsp:Transcript_10358/g.12019  ORF Transcript_10358/g.12019 Transcript_10358/m.12019 type:complete len:693 (+) Transcript_10358:130-2208(+)